MANTCVLQYNPHQDQLRKIYAEVVSRSINLPETERLIMYDPHDDEEIAVKVGNFVKRLDSRRGSKPKPKLSGRVMVLTPFDKNMFNFTKIKNMEERLYEVVLNGKQYDVLTNKFPLCANHMLLVARDLVPQQMNLTHLQAIVELLRGSSMFAYFNSWGAAASVNHLHIHVIDESPPLMKFKLEEAEEILGSKSYRMKGYPGYNYVFQTSQLEVVDQIIRMMQQENQPHNLFFSSDYIYLFPRTCDISAKEKSLEIYGEKVGGLEFTGIFTVYSGDRYKTLTYPTLCDLLRMNTSSLKLNTTISSSDSYGSFYSTDMSTTDSDAMSQGDDDSSDTLKKEMDM